MVLVKQSVSLSLGLRGCTSGALPSKLLVPFLVWPIPEVHMCFNPPWLYTHSAALLVVIFLEVLRIDIIGSKILL